MTDIRKAAMQAALKALESCETAAPSDGERQWYDPRMVEPAIEGLRAALAQPEPKYTPNDTSDALRRAADRALDWLGQGGSIPGPSIALLAAWARESAECAQPEQQAEPNDAKDAARYRWLRDTEGSYATFGECSFDTMDEIVDAAMAAEAAHPPAQPEDTISVPRELLQDADRWRALSKRLRAHGNPMEGRWKLVEVSPTYGDEYNITDIERAVDALLAGKT